MRASAAGPLHGLGVLVTRPAHQAQALQRLIEAAGGRAFLFPLLDIKPLNDPSGALSWIRDLARYDVAVFVSANAVEHGLGLIALHGGTLGAIEVIAVGKATARRLEERGITPAAVPSEASSEGVLRLDTLAADRIAGKRVLIFRGTGGRELLAEGLRRREALVDYAEVYERGAAEVDPKPLLGLWDRGEIGAVIVTSAAALEHLVSMGAGIGRERLLDVTLVVLSERLAARARQLGFRRPPLVATEAGDAGLFSALTAWRTQQEPLDYSISNAWGSPG
jgi:uroporphyrinogen-III synthase